MRRTPVMCALVVVVAGACSRPAQAPASVSAEGLPADVSQTVEFVLAGTIGPRGTLLAARIVDPSPGLHVVAVGLVQSGIVANGEAYPPRHPVTRIPAPYEGSTLVAFAIRADRAGTYDGLGVELTWTAGGTTTTKYQPIGFRLCVGASTCDPSPVTRKIEALHETAEF
jgi:hypothetical protein